MYGGSGAKMCMMAARQSAVNSFTSLFLCLIRKFCMRDAAKDSSFPLSDMSWSIVFKYADIFYQSSSLDLDSKKYTPSI